MSQIYNIYFLICALSLIKLSVCLQVLNITTCAACTAESYHWCNIDQKCYSILDFSNPCSYYEGITNSKLCGCLPNCVPQPGLSTDACEWYTEGNIGLPPANPDDWTGGHFLLKNYKEAAHCACSGGIITSHLKKKI